jgi:DNA ligase-1
LKELLKKVIDRGGEGLMLRKPGSYYVAKRDSSLLKVKLFHDEEARVIGHSRGEGRLAVKFLFVSFSVSSFAHSLLYFVVE